MQIIGEVRNNMKQITEFDGRSILIWGYGREGKSTEAFLKSHTKAAHIEVYEGDRAGIDEAKYDVIFKSPGIVMHENDPKYTSQTELFLKLFRDQVIGITGTKGKSTTSALMYHVLNELLPQSVILLGNIGLPCLDYVDEIDDDTVIIFEMSCHQLAHASISPHVAVFLNLYEEHLDYYGSFVKYFAAKCNIAEHQTKDDLFYKGANVPAISSKAKTTIIEGWNVKDYQLKILGKHNNVNAEFVKRIATEVFGLDETAVEQSLQGFEGLSHRLQHIGIKNGINFYDDSISTIPEAAIAALESVGNAQTILIGGMDRGIKYDSLTDYIKQHPEYNYILMYASGKRIYDSLSDLDYCCYEEDLEKAVSRALQITDEGRACLLSPAAASYGYFKNFEERGDAFRALLGL